MSVKEWSFSLLVATAFASACLPVDTRPTPASVVVSVTGSTAAKNGIAATETTDGWSITFDRFIVALGGARLEEGDADCTPYADAGYRRVFDATNLDVQRLGILYGLGTCRLRFGLRSPEFDSILMPHTTSADVAVMRTGGTDHYVHATANAPDGNGVSILVHGSARKDATTKTFSWAFRLGRVQYTGCSRTHAASEVKLDLQGGQANSVELHVHAETLFQDGLDPTTAKLRFGPFAAGDDPSNGGDGNGDVTLDELGQLSLEKAGAVASDLALLDPGAASWTTFEDLVYLGLFPRVVRRADAPWCQVGGQGQGRGR